MLSLHQGNFQQTKVRNNRGGSGHALAVAELAQRQISVLFETKTVLPGWENQQHTF